LVFRVIGEYLDKFLSCAQIFGIVMNLDLTCFNGKNRLLAEIRCSTATRKLYAGNDKGLVTCIFYCENSVSVGTWLNSSVVKYSIVKSNSLSGCESNCS